MLTIDRTDQQVLKTPKNLQSESTYLCHDVAFSTGDITFPQLSKTEKSKINNNLQRKQR